ncbi:MAG: hypothetical protein F6J90_13955 [Moorea sp. SIOASIH]|uniref:hypothetical protein n=1 Tax=Moorena sp. SIOASIH TaxID=2607817 RepID=UPI0013B9E0B0|nr:hypothetical protein [Moorena sp. SIOASIH]NEO37365.1 hypothetical protein [Moorena sp. SIOASIH]
MGEAQGSGFWGVGTEAVGHATRTEQGTGFVLQFVARKNTERSLDDIERSLDGIE